MLREQEPPTIPQGVGRTAGLAQLAEAFAYAQDQGCDPWQFALAIATLLAAGVTESELRWLVSKGYAKHACEITTAQSVARKFRPSHNLAFVETTRIILTAAGADYLATGSGRLPMAGLPVEADREVASSMTATTPFWDADGRSLRVGGWIVKRYRRPSPSQETILEAFQEEGWPHRIDDPLPPLPELDSKSRLHDTIKRLNRHHKHPLLCFRGDGTGEGIQWEYVKAATPSSSSVLEDVARLHRVG
jgi:hypothetical protein